MTMLEILDHFFAVVCSQNPDHSWAPGGLMLPCCQRCTGLYVGAFAATGLLLWLRPRISGRFLLVHGLFLLQMAPFGFHWLPQGPMLRTWTGLLLGYGVVSYLWLTPASRLQTSPTETAHAMWKYSLGLCASVLLTSAAAVWGGRSGAFLLSVLVFAGSVSLAGLLLANFGLGLISLAGLCRHARPGALT